jgi:hypothetical protein
VPKELLRRLRDPEMYNKHALPTQDSGRCWDFICVGSESTVLKLKKNNKFTRQ